MQGRIIPFDMNSRKAGMKPSGLWELIKGAYYIEGIKYPPCLDIENVDFGWRDISNSDF